MAVTTLLTVVSATLLMIHTAASATRDVVIFDTDCGIFGDDGAALVMLVRSPEQVTIPGITIVPGNVWGDQAAEYVFHILDLLRRPQIPVYTGAATPLIHTAAMANESIRRWGALEFKGAFEENDPTAVVPAPGASLTGRHPHRQGAVNFIISEIERQPGEVTLFAIGPMTNIALALRLKPDIETKIKRIVFMGGNYKVSGNVTPMAEFNFWFDPEAARIVLRSHIPHKIMFGLDICNLAPLRKAEFDQIANAHTPITDLFREDLGNRYPKFLTKPNAMAYMWDALAAAYLIDPGFVTRSEVRHLDVVTEWGKFYGATIPLDVHLAAGVPPVTIALDLDYRRVFALYKEKLIKSE
jgi:inosine-uridine nucleoside N-ribohydrolase